MKTKPLVLWIISVGFALLTLAGIALMVHRIVSNPPKRDAMAIASLHPAKLDSVLSANKMNDFIRIPTGLFIQSLEFASAYGIRITGYVWQTAAGGIPVDSLGVIFPEAVTMKMTKAYQDTNVIGWYYETTLRQPFNPSHYSFDREEVWIRMWPKDFHRNLILVPDFTSYDSFERESKPGLEKSILIEGWKVESTHFRYRLNRYNTNFGVAENITQRQAPELYFNIIIKRD